MQSEFTSLNKNLMAIIVEYLNKSEKLEIVGLYYNKLFSIVLRSKKTLREIISVGDKLKICTTQKTIHTFLYVERYFKDSVICGCTSGYLSLLNIEQGTLKTVTNINSKHQGYVQKLIDLNIPNKNLIASSSDDSNIYVWDVNGFSIRHSIKSPHICYCILKIEYEGNHYLIVATFQQLIFHKLVFESNKEDFTSVEQFSLRGHENYIYCLLFLPKVDPDLLISGGYGKKLFFWNVKTRLGESIQAHSEGIWSMVHLKSVDKKFIATGSWDKHIKIWDVIQRTNILDYLAHSGMIYGLINSKFIDQRYMVSSSYDNKIKIWKYDREKQELRFILEREFANTVRICSIYEINHQPLLFVSVTTVGVFILKLHLL